MLVVYLYKDCLSTILMRLMKFLSTIDRVVKTDYSKTLEEIGDLCKNDYAL